MGGSQKKVRVVDLFAGIGGLRSGVEKSIKGNGLQPEVVFTSEIKASAVDTLKLNYPDCEIHGDITKTSANEVPAHDILLAGFPCQAFSHAGRRAGFADKTRGTLFFDVARILEHHKPDYFILENVEGIIKHDTDPNDRGAPIGKTMKVILDTLQELGYSVDWRLLNATEFGVPQARKRVFIVGSLNDAADLSQIKTKRSRPLKAILETGISETDDDIKDFEKLLLKTYPNIEILEGKIFRDWRGGDRNIHSWNINYKGKTTRQERAFLEILMKESKKNQWAPKAKKVGEGHRLTPRQIRQFYKEKSLEDLTKMLGKLAGQGYLEERGGTYRIIAGKLSMPVSHILDGDKYANTLVATDADRLVVIDNGHLRRFSDNEVKALFGFNKRFKLPPDLKRSQMFDLFGNSVVIPVAKSVADTLLSGK